MMRELNWYKIILLILEKQIILQYLHVLLNMFYILVMSEPLIQARWLLSIWTSNQIVTVESARVVTESRISTLVPSCNSIASSVRSLGVRGEVLSNVEGTVTTASVVEVAHFVALYASTFDTTQTMARTIAPKNPIFRKVTLEEKI